MRSQYAYEPVVTIGSVQAVIGAFITLLAAFGLKLTADQTAAILGFYAVVAPLVFSLWARRKVTPVPPPAPGD